MSNAAKMMVLKGGLIRDTVDGGLYRVLYISPDDAKGYWIYKLELYQLKKTKCKSRKPQNRGFCIEKCLKSYLVCIIIQTKYDGGLDYDKNSLW